MVTQGGIVKKLIAVAVVVGMALIPTVARAADSPSSTVAAVAPQDIRQAITQETWSPLAKSVPYLSYIDHNTGERIVGILSTDPNAKQATEDATAAFGDNVVLQSETSMDTLSGSSRNVDTNPHWGGAAIDIPLYPPGFPTLCSSGFAANGFPFAQWQIYAGHCQQFADNVGQAEWVAHANGSVVNGWAFGLDGRYPDVDATLQFPDNVNEHFDGKIWTGSDPVNPRPVSGKKGAVYGTFICMDGSVSINHCNDTVILDNKTGQLCNVGPVVGCINHLNIAQESLAGPHVMPGDSGGPVYYKTTAPPLGAALASGIINARTVAEDGTPYVWFTDIGAILNAFGITLKTCC